MKRRKSLLVYSLLLGGIVTTGAASCGEEGSQTPEQDQFVFKLEYNSEGGSVFVDKKSGYIYEDTVVKINVIANEGYVAESISINGVPQEASKKEFSIKPMSGTNIVSVKFVEKTEEDEDTYNVKVTYSEGGVAEVDKTSGNVGEDVNITITPNEGYEVAHLFINGVEVDKDERSFTPVKGDNLVDVEFSKTPDLPTYEILIETEGEGEVKVDKENGYVGETVKISIEPAPNNEVKVVKINDQEKPTATISFQPIEGVNKIYVEFGPFEGAINKGIEFTGLSYPNSTDFASADDFYEFILDKVEPYFPDMDRDATKEWFESLDFYKSFALRYGFNKNNLDYNFRYLLNKDLIDLLTNPKSSGFTNEDATVIGRFLYDAIHNLSLEEFAGLVAFGSYALIINSQTNNNPNNLLNYENYNTFIGAQNSALSLEAKNYLNKLIDDSSFDFEDSLNEYLKFVDVISEFIYKPFKAILNNYTATDFSDLIYNVISLTGRSDQGQNFVLKDNDYVEMAKLLSNIFDKNFFSKSSFLRICSTLNELSDPVDVLMKVLPNNKNLIYFGGMKDAINLLNENSELVYYLIKTLGKMATSIDQEFVNKIINVFADPTQTNEKKIATTFAYIGNLFEKGLAACNSGGSDVTSLFKNSSSFFKGIKNIISSGYNVETDETSLDTTSLVEALLDSSKKDPLTLSDSEIEKYNKTYNDFISFWKLSEKVVTTYPTSADEYYTVGEKTKVTVFDNDKNDITDQVVIDNFDTTTIGYRRMKITYPNDSITYKSYFVTYSGSYVDVPKITLNKNDSFNYNTRVVVYDDENPNGETVLINNFEVGDIKTNQLGTFYSYIKNSEGDYFFFEYIVK